MPAFTIVGIGEILWDFLPTGKHLGGIGANVAYHASALGDRGIALGTVGADALGEEAITFLRKHGVDVSHVQRDPIVSTGTVSVSVGKHGHPTFGITGDVAWDHMQYTDDWREAGRQADAVCFGTLAQRSEQSRAATLAFLDDLPEECLVVFDVNLRQFFYTPESIRASLRRAHVCKLNEQELPTVASILGIPVTTAAETAQRLREQFDLRCVAVTRGKRGGTVVSAEEIVDHPGYAVDVKDSVGAGDAFTAGFIHGLLRSMDLRTAFRIGAQRGAWVASHPGGMPHASTFDESMYA